MHPSLLCSSQTFSSPRSKALCPLSSYSSFPPPELLATTNLLSASVVLPVSDISCKRNHMMCDFLCLTSFIQQNAFEFQPLGSRSGYFIPLYGWIMLHCVAIWQFVYPVTFPWTFELCLPLTTFWIALLWICVYWFECLFSILWGKTLILILTP